MCPTITAITTYVLQQLDVRRFWTVRSVYKKTVNIQAGELLLALQAASSPMSPISMLTDMEVRDFEALPVKPGQQVSISRDRIHISSLETPVTFLLRPKEVQSTRLTSPPAQFPWGRLLSQVRQAITGSQAGIFRLLFCDFTDHEKAWIIRTTANTCKDLLKSHWRRTTVAMEAASHIPAPELEEGSLSAAVNLLPPKYRAVIYLYYYEGYSSKEIARLLGRNPATVATQLRRGRTQLKDLLESEGSS